MKSRTTADFWKRFDRLPVHVRETARKQFRLWTTDPSHPSVEFKPLAGLPNAYSARVTRDYRVVGRRYDDTVYWGWIGTHAQYDQLLKRLD